MSLPGQRLSRFRSRAHPRAGPALLVALTAMAGAPAGALGQSRDWTPAERTVLGDFTRISAVATSLDRVYAVSPDALLVYDPLGRRWEGPYSPRDPGLLRDVFAALADPIDNSLWLVRRSGWIRFDPGIQLWEQGFVAGTVLEAALDQNAPAAGLFLRTSGGWYTALRGGAAIPAGAPGRPMRPGSVDQAIRDNPAIQANLAGLLFSARFRMIRYTAAARAGGFAGQGWYLGTNGAGLVYFPDGAGLPQPLTFGLPGEAADALFVGTGGVWVVTERSAAADPALSFVAGDLGSFHWYQGPRASGLPFSQARRVIGRGSSLWLATDVGAIRIRPKDEDIERFDAGRGLPDSRVVDLAQRKGRLVAATMHGLAEFSDSAGFQRIAPDFTDVAQAVELSGDTTWVGTRIGLFAALPGQSDLLQPDALGAALSLQASVVDLIWRGDTLVALTPDRLLWRAPGTGEFTLGPLLGSGLGPLHSLANSRDGLYIAGDRGAGFAQLNTPVSRVLSVPGDLPGQVTDVAVDDSYLWVTTLKGLVRFRLDVVGR
jgi:hypothetical protein